MAGRGVFGLCSFSPFSSLFNKHKMRAKEKAKAYMSRRVKMD
jgi:hypothetical protein